MTIKKTKIPKNTQKTKKTSCTHAQSIPYAQEKKHVPPSVTDDKNVRKPLKMLKNDAQYHHRSTEVGGPKLHSTKVSTSSSDRTVYFLKDASDELVTEKNMLYPVG